MVDSSIVILRSFDWCSFSRISPLIAILFLKLLLGILCSLNKIIEKINIIKVRVEVLLSDFQSLKKLGGEIVLGNFWELELFFVKSIGSNLSFIQTVFWLTQIN